MWLMWFLILGGIVMILVSFFIPLAYRELVRGIGLSLFPSGVVAMFVSQFASHTTEILLNETLRKAVEDTVGVRLKESMGDIDTTVAKGLAKISNDTQRLSPLLISSARLGLEDIHLTRAEGLVKFSSFIDGETQRAEHGEPAQVWIIASSMKGFLEIAVEDFDGRTTIAKIVKSKCNLRILMTDPKIADARAHQEKRLEGQIPDEIRSHLSYLKHIGVQRESVKYYPGTPTVFGVATTDRMLLNPYPYQREAFRCFSLIVSKTLYPSRDIFDQYLESHFEEPWRRGTEISPQEWDKL